MAFPDLTVIMAHIGHPWQVDCIAVVRKHPNIWADVSGSVLRPWGHYNAMRAATEWGVLDKLLFGSDYPASTPTETMERLRDVNSVIRGTALPPCAGGQNRRDHPPRQPRPPRDRGVRTEC